MSEIRLQIDGIEVKAKEGMTILTAAQSAGIFIPTLCHHEKLEPYGACRICVVEVDARGRTTLVAACLYPVESDMGLPLTRFSTRYATSEMSMRRTSRRSGARLMYARISSRTILTRKNARPV